MQHTPVLVKEVIQFLAPKPNENFIDCNLGLAGHSQAILEKTAPHGRLLGIDLDSETLQQARLNLKKFAGRFSLVNDNFANLAKIVQENNFGQASGILFDLGLSSWHLDESGRGFTFTKNEPLDMRFGEELRTCRQIINRYSEKNLANIFYNLSDIKNSRSLAKKICQAREKQEILTTADLVSIIGTNNPKFLAPIWQALRIEVNQELDNLKKALDQVVDLLESDGRLVVISFHSGEDRLVKYFFRDQKDNQRMEILTKKPIQASIQEINNNSRARSAKLRAAKKC